MYIDLQIERNTDPGDDPGGSRSRVWAMNGENRLLVQMNRSSLSLCSRLQEKSPIILEESIKYTLIS